MSRVDSAYPPSIQAGIPKLSRLPRGWSRVALGDLLRPVYRPVELLDDQVYQLVTAKRSRGGIVARERLAGRDIKVKDQYEVRAGDFILSNRQISHGGVGLVPGELDKAIVSGEYTVLDPRGPIDFAFLNAFSHSTYFQQICFHSSIGVHVEKLVFRLEDWLAWEINLPPLDEQRRIADALAVWDRAIETAEALVEAKRQRKAALLQALLSNVPKRPLLDLADVWFSGVDKKTVDGQKPVRLCNYMDVFHNAEITPDLPFMAASASDREITANALRKGDVVFTKDSETAEEIAESALVAEDIENLICGYHLAIARPRAGETDGEYLAQAMRQTQVRKAFARSANGVVRFGLTLEVLEQIELPAPSISRQREIAAILWTEDRSTAGVLKQLESLRNQKRGLMQRLLTGEWRLPARASEAAA
jgi:type I restriction enzyme S subunit